MFGDRMPLFAHQCKNQMTGFTVQYKMMRFGEGIQRGISLGLIRLVSILDAFALSLELLPLQAQWDFRLQYFRHMRHELTQHTPLSGRQTQGTRTLRRIEVVQIA